MMGEAFSPVSDASDGGGVLNREWWGGCSHPRVMLGAGGFSPASDAGDWGCSYL